MSLDRVTITGADDSIAPFILLQLSREFPFVEWGILVSASHAGTPRFPSKAWIKDLQTLAMAHQQQNQVRATYDRTLAEIYPFQLALHVCGRWVRTLLQGLDQIPPGLLEGFQRVQLNFHEGEHPCAPRAFYGALRTMDERQIIFQLDGQRGANYLEAIYQENDFAMVSIDAMPLFDTSGGAGITPPTWPPPRYTFAQANRAGQGWVYHGYAGGLGPENLAQELPRILEAAGDARIWIDCETHVRSSDDLLFDRAKIREFLAIAAPFVTREETMTHE